MCESSLVGCFVDREKNVCRRQVSSGVDQRDGNATPGSECCCRLGRRSGCDDEQTLEGTGGSRDHSPQRASGAANQKHLKVSTIGDGGQDPPHVSTLLRHELDEN